MNFSPHPADIWTTEKLVQLHPSSAARQGSCKNALAFCYHIQTIWSGSHQPLNQKKASSTSSSQQVRDAAKTSALKLKSLVLPGGHLCWRAQIARTVLCHLQAVTRFDALSVSSKDGLRGIISGTQLQQQPTPSSDTSPCHCKLPSHFSSGCNRVMLRVHPSAVCQLNKDSLWF